MNFCLNNIYYRSIIYVNNFIHNKSNGKSSDEKIADLKQKYQEERDRTMQEKIRLDYESLEFNSIYIFKDFRKKYFNISSIIYTYNETENQSQIEFDFEIYDEEKNLIPEDNIYDQIDISNINRKFYSNTKN